MNDLSELELRILAVLEELGFENIPAMMNTILSPNGSSDEISKFQATLSSLLDSALIEIHMSSLPTGFVPLSREAALTEIAGLQQHLKFVEVKKYWTDDRMTGPPYFQELVPEIVRTDAGLQRGIAVLEARGYEWWRNSR
jgi:hypothetical protein